MSSLAKSENQQLRLDGKVAAIAGGTQGIGAATGIRFAQAGASVYVIGRDEARGASVVQELKNAAGQHSQGKTFEFIKADLSLVSGIKQVAKTLEEKAGPKGISYLVQTQGKPPNGKFGLNSEGHESHFAIQLLSRFALSYLLAESGTLKEAVINVCAPSGPGGTPPDAEDLEMIQANEKGQFGIIKCATRDSNVMDAVTSQFNTIYNPKGIKAYHIYPGFVATNALSNAGLPYPIVVLGGLFAPLLARTIGNTPTSYAEIPVYLAGNPKSRALGLEFSNEKLKPMKPSWLDEQPAKSKLVWDKLVGMVQQK
ncbi:NAD(P)-binding protein [Meredithblackwellia eburnea MCA 4105]